SQTSLTSANNPRSPSQDTRQPRQLVSFRHKSTPRKSSAASLSDPAYMAMHTKLSTAENIKPSEKR
ncbi:MAG: hypothetical protein NTZ54_02290, partial [Alphaproteobacteria bacterium]|nr:hypothetical protein [Alphaproteobacteria bacterium]